MERKTVNLMPEKKSPLKDKKKKKRDSLQLKKSRKLKQI